MANPSSTGMWYNADGLLVKFPDYYANAANFINRARLMNSWGPVRIIQYQYDLTKLASGNIAFTTDTDNSGTVDGFNAGDVYIPAKSAVVAARLYVGTPAAGGTSIAFDLYELDGSWTTITNHSIYTTTAGAIANLTPQGAIVAPDGVIPFNSSSYVAADAIPSRDAFLAIKVNGTFTAGTGMIEVAFVPTQADVSTDLVGA